MLTWRDVWVYVRMLIRWWWVLAVCVGLAAGIAYWVAQQQPDYYRTRAVLMVGDNFSAAVPDQYAFGLSNTLAQFYAVMAGREAILQPVVDQLELPYSWDVLGKQVYASVNSQASLLEIWITDTNPDRAAAIASAIVAELIRFSPNSPEKIAEQRAVFEQQLQETEQNLQGVDQRLSELQTQQGTLVSAVDLRAVDEQIAELQKVRDRYQETYNQLLDLRNSTTVNSLSLFEAPVRPDVPLPSKRLLTVAVAGLGGGILALLAILLLEALDDRWRTSRDLRNRFGLAELGTVPAGPPLGSGDAAAEVRREQAVRDAHTRVLLAALERGTRLLLVTSPNPNESRSAMVVDMARLFTRSGYRVLLVDADMTEPNLTRLVGNGDQAMRPVLIHNADSKVWSHLQPTSIDQVMLLSRHIGPDGRPMAPTLPWPDLVQSLNRAADVIIFDGPSALSSADAALLAPLVDGVVLALDPSTDRRGAILESKSRLLRRRGANLLGAVVIEPAPNRRRWLGIVPPSRQLPAESTVAQSVPPAEPQVGAAAHTANAGVAGSGLSSVMAQAIERGLLLAPGTTNASRAHDAESIEAPGSDSVDILDMEADPPAAVAHQPTPSNSSRRRRSKGGTARPLRRERAIGD
ncbi:MAG: lipopolysaccharide biosynthesis protein [Oscillochloris sp.]|nr:lipopolysaccharide biosynthesis protein [Oscillochloris sp.]